VSSPNVDIYVGPKRKHFLLPRDLLIHHSEYFNRRFNGFHPDPNLINKTTVHLLDENADNFSLLVDYIFRGQEITALPEQDVKAKATRCFAFITQSHKFEMTHATAAIHPVLKQVLISTANTAELLKPEHVQLVLELLPKGNVVGTLVLQAALPEVLKKDGGKFRKELEENDKFGAEMLRAIKAAGSKGKVTLLLPLDVKKKMKTFSMV
jgi:hypothetical protein